MESSCRATRPKRGAREQSQGCRADCAPALAAATVGPEAGALADGNGAFGRQMTELSIVTISANPTAARKHQSAQRVLTQMPRHGDHIWPKHIIRSDKAVAHPS
jgi:hypothetical protein